MSERLDLVVLGASGFTGKLMVEYLANNKEASNIKWGVAGRDKRKLGQILAKHKLDGKIPIIEASIDNQKSLVDLCAQTRVLLNAVGPFAKYGEPVIKACLESRCHYLDITGEPGFIRHITDNYHQEALQKGVKIVHSVGFDSAPADLGTQYLLEQFPIDENLWTDFNESFVTVDAFVKLVLPDLCSYGTFSTIVHSLNTVSIFGNKKQTTKPVKKEKTKKTPNRGIHFEKLVNSYVLPFSTSDPTIVNRTAEIDGYFSNKKAPFTYSHYLQIEKWYNLALLILSAIIIFITTRFSFGANLLLWLWLKIKGEGPREGIRDQGSFSMTFLGHARFKKGIQKVICNVSANGDPGYVETAKWAVQAAFCLLDVIDGKKKELQSGGVLTPASCLGVYLRERLEAVGMKFVTKHTSFAADKDDEKTILTAEAKKYVYMT
jgi:short subunit dehydrogenase-like uncharacterized protein